MRDVFFDDVRDHLVGQRPEYGQATSSVASKLEAEKSLSDTSVAPAAATWSKLIDAETIEAEIKRLAQALAEDLATPGKFKGGAYTDCRRHFSVLAMLFAVAAEYDGAVRWYDVAPAMRDGFARAGYNCEVGTDETYQEASQRNQELIGLIRGSRPKAPAAKRTAVWGQVADRVPLMQRLEIAHDQRLRKWLADEREFRQHRNEVRHEAQLAAMIAEVIGREGFEFWDDEQYAQYARELRQAAVEIDDAAELENFKQAQTAVGRATRACNRCHEGYRG